MSDKATELRRVYEGQSRESLTLTRRNLRIRIKELEDPLDVLRERLSVVDELLESGDSEGGS